MATAEMNEEYEQTCIGCGSPFEAAEPTDLCPGCEESDE